MQYSMEEDFVMEEENAIENEKMNLMELPDDVKLHIVKELEKQLLIEGSESFQQLSAKNKIAFDSIVNFLDKKFGVEWRPKDLVL